MLNIGEDIVRVVRAAAAAALLTVAASASAQARPVQVYPLLVTEAGPKARGDAQALVVTAVKRAVRATSPLVAANPLVTGASCGSDPAPECVARIAGVGVVVFGSVVESPETFSVTLYAVDGRGQVYGPARALSSYVQSANPLVRAIQDLLGQVSAAGSLAGPSTPPTTQPPVTAANISEATKAPATVATPPETAQAPVTAARDPEAVQPPVTATRAPQASQPPATAPQPEFGTVQRDPRPVPGAWRGPAGKFLFTSGVALLSAGVTAVVRDRPPMERHSPLTNGLLIGGGVVTLTGATIWSLAPDVSVVPGRVHLGVGGRF